MSAAAARGWRVTYGGRRIGGVGGQSRRGGGAMGGGSGGGEARAGAFALAEVPLAFADQSLLVALHPLQLLLCAHAAASLAARKLLGLCGRGQTLQGTLGSLLVREKSGEGCRENGRTDKWR